MVYSLFVRSVQLSEENIQHCQNVTFLTFFFFFFVVHFWLPGSGSGFPVRIQIHRQLDTDPKHRFVAVLCFFFVKYCFLTFCSVLVKVKINYPGFQDDEQKADTDANSG